MARRIVIVPSLLASDKTPTPPKKSYWESYVGDQVCALCDGTGRIDGIECEACLGTGYTIVDPYINVP